MRNPTWAAVASIVILGTLAAASCAMAEEQEETTTIDKLPTAVKAAIEKATVGGSIEKIDKDQEGGKVVYDVDYVKDGEKKEIEVAEDGTLVISSKDEDDDDKGEDESDSEDDSDERGDK